MHARAHGGPAERREERFQSLNFSARIEKRYEKFYHKR
jgi:hypothetical protein